LGVHKFPIRQKVDDDGEIIEDDDDDIRFKCGRPGNHLMVPFQCEVCHFRNIMLTDPDGQSARDVKMMDLMRRANLDAFWSREISTVKSNLREAIRMEKMAKRFGMPCITPVMGPWPLEDSLGMKVAMALLARSLDKGIYEETVQWDTFRRTMSAVTNISQACVGGLSDSVGAYERNKIFITGVVTHKFWYSRFMLGVHKRVGQIRKPDKEVTIEVIHAADRILEAEWNQATSAVHKKKVAEMGT
jgi:hypothetical protein